MIGEFDSPQARWPPREVHKFIYHQSYPSPRKYQYADKIAQDYYEQYLTWQQSTNDPLLAKSNWWADNWEELGKYL